MGVQSWGGAVQRQWQAQGHTPCECTSSLQAEMCAFWQVVLTALSIFSQEGNSSLERLGALPIYPAGGYLSGASDPVSFFPLQSPAGRGIPPPTGCLAAEGPFGV